MLIDFSRLLFLTVVELLRRAYVGVAQQCAACFTMPAFLVELGCARRMEILVRRLFTMGMRIDMVKSQLRSGRNVAAIEGDMEFRRMLAIVKVDMRALQCEAAAWRNDRHASIVSARLSAALLSVASMSERIYRLADELLWELAERDQAVQTPPERCDGAATRC